MDRATMKYLFYWIIGAAVVVLLAIWLVNTLAPAGAADLGPDQDLAEAQARLTQLGYDTGYADGINGPITEAAIAGYQQHRCLEPTGTLDKRTWATLWSKRQHGCSLYAEPGSGSGGTGYVDLKCLGEGCR